MAGRPPWVPTTQEREQVKTLAGRGVPEKMIAAIVNVDKLTLRKHCAAELQLGRAAAVANVLGVCYKQAMAGEFNHARLFLANAAGIHLTQKIEHAGRIDTDRLERGKARAEAAARAASGAPGVADAQAEASGEDEDADA